MTTLVEDVISELLAEWDESVIAKPQVFDATKEYDITNNSLRVKQGEERPNVIDFLNPRVHIGLNFEKHQGN